VGLNLWIYIIQKSKFESCIFSSKANNFRAENAQSNGINGFWREGVRGKEASGRNGDRFYANNKIQEEGQQIIKCAISRKEQTAE